MKLRILDNSLRLRLSRSQVQSVAAGKTVMATMRFGLGQELRYHLLSVHEARAVTAVMEGNTISVILPTQIAEKWANGSDISITAEQPLGDGRHLFLLIEKDFVCLKPRQHAHEDESDLFPNPNYEQGHC